MAQRYIYLSDELNTKLKTEKNVSQLISLLLNEHYKFNYIDEKGLIYAKEKIEREKNEVLEKKGNELKKIDKMIKQQEEEKLFKEEEIKMSVEKEKKLLNSIKENVVLFCDVDVSEIDRIAEMYLVEMKDYSSFFDWCNAKGIILKEVKQDVE